ncbi:MAG: right-handed parallel beta-helix repeat-containing protein [Nitrospirota bacterium]
MDIFPTQKRTFAATHISKSRASSLCKRVVPAVAFCVLLQPLGTAIAADYYVDGNNTSASDTNPGAAASPWKTMYKAMAAPLQPGDTVHVMAGTYDASVGGTWSQPALRPSSSGAQGNPITFRAEPRQSVILDTKNTPSTPAIGVRLQNYIVIDGFVIPSAEAKGIAVFGISGAKVIGVVLQNNIVHGVWQAGVPGDNTDGIRLEYTSGTIVRNNIIYNVDNPAHSENAAGIKMYHNDTALIENNEIYNTVSGIFDKEQGDNNTFRRNYLHNVKLGIYLQSGGSGNSIVGDQMSENVINQVVQGIGILPADGTLTDNITITNNVIANYTDTGVFPASTGTFNIYNNIFHRTGSSLRGDLFTYNDPPNSIVLMDYNLFVTEPKFYIGVYLTNRVISTLHAWQNATVHDPHSNVGDAAFVGAATGDFHLKANSPAIGAGRVGGVSTGDHVNQGAYITGSEIIGPTGGIDGGGSGGGNTPPPSSSSGGDSGGGSGGGGGCGFVKDINGKGPKAKGEGLAFAVMLIITLAGIALIRRIIVGLKMRRAFFALIKGLSFFVVAVLLAQIAACGSGGGGDSSNFSNNSSGGSGGDTGGGTGSGVTATLLLTTSGQYYTLPDDLTTAGTAVSISANDVTLDLNGKTITYNASSSGSRVYGVYVAVGVSRVTVKNGTILQGAGNTADSPAIYIYGASWASGHTISDMVIRVTGFQTNGIQADNGYGFNNSQIYRTYVELHGDTTAMDGYGGDPITVCATNTGGIQIHDNVLVAGHRGIQACSVGTSQANPSAVYNNRIQQVRRMGSKAPYGILLDGKSHNVAIHDNQIVSDDGRGINLDGWGQNNTEGTSNNHVYNNRIDVQYSTTATNGAYVENNLYGIRDRYASGDNLIEYNTVLVASNIQGDIYGMYIGSDGADPGMKNIVVRNNTIIARRGTVPTDTPYVFCFDYADSITATNNSYITHGGFNETSLCHNAVNPLIVSGNTVLSPPATISPAAPTSVQITHFLDSYMITWNANSEADVYEYVVYRDGVKLPISPRGGTFYVDVGINGTHNYSVSALTLTGVEGAQSVSVSTNTAKNGWW